MNQSTKFCHLYISPLEQCNLCCKMCYTTKTANRLSSDQIITFIDRYNQIESVQTITFCGGEVFILPDFVDLVNRLTDKGMYIQTITNGTIDVLNKFHQPNLNNMIVSLDGLPEYHDQNRGKNRWQQSLNFLKKAIELGFHTEVFSIVTRENLSDLDRFEARLKHELGQPISVTYHPRKPIEYLQAHPFSNQVGETSGFSFITADQRLELSRHHHIFPDPNLGCYQVSLMSDGKVYGCCEGIRPIGTIDSDIHDILDTFKHRVDPLLDCVEPDFVCGLKSTCKRGALCH